jgi:tetrahydromethanopterin:alpha-L-glutamate ligase
MPRSPDRLAAKPAKFPARIGLVVDRVDWHAREFAKAFAALGVQTVPVKLPLSGFATRSMFGLSIDGFADTLPDAIVVRSIPGGTFEAVTLRLGILHALRELGIVVWNDARAIERCVDKSMTSFLLARAGIPTPPTWAMESREAARAIVRRELAQGPLVLKPLFGSQGRGLRLIRTVSDLPDPDNVAGVYYLQRFVAVERDGYRDFRLIVSQGRVIAAMVRHSTAWITNLKQGGRPIAAVADAEMKALAVGAAAAVGADFAGVDILHGADGRATVLEVNSMPAWSGLQKVTTANIASIIAADVIAVLHARTRREAAG